MWLKDLKGYSLQCKPRLMSTCPVLLASCLLLQYLSWGDTTALSESSDNHSGFIRIHLVTVTLAQPLQKHQGPLSVKLPPQTTSCSFMPRSLFLFDFYHSFPFVFLSSWDFPQPVGSIVPLLTMLYPWKITWECYGSYPSAPYVFWHGDCRFWQQINGILFFIMQSTPRTHLCA